MKRFLPGLIRFPLIVIVMVSIIISCKNQTKNIGVIRVQDKDLGFEMPVIQEPFIPANSASIIDFGAVSGGIAINTKAFAGAIDFLEGKGGGKVIIPRGVWLTGPIILKSNIELHADEGAVVIFSADKDLYPLVETIFEGNGTYRCISPIYGKDLENIAITGKGIFDGTGEAWRPVKKEKLTESQWKALLASGGVVSSDKKTWYPSQSYLDGQNLSSMNVPSSMHEMKDFIKIKDFLRPVMVSLVNCRRVLLDGPTFQNSPAWCIHPLLCQDIIIRNIVVRNPWFSQNGDGLDIESSVNGVVYSSNFDVGDDAICIKSGKDAEGRKRAKPAENLVIKDCIVYHGHGGVTIGSEMSGGVKNVFVSGCTFIGTDVGLRFKSNRGRGGVVENIHFRDINMTNIPTQAISFNMYYGGLSVSEMLAQGILARGEEGVVPPVSEETPGFRNISFKNIICRGAEQAVLLQGLPELNLENISMENVSFVSDNGLACFDASGIKITGMTLITKDTVPMSFVNSHDINIEGIKLSGDHHSSVMIKGNKSDNIAITSGSTDQVIKAIINSDADKKTIIIK